MNKEWLSKDERYLLGLVQSAGKEFIEVNPNFIYSVLLSLSLVRERAAELEKQLLRRNYLRYKTHLRYHLRTDIEGENK